MVNAHQIVTAHSLSRSHEEGTGSEQRARKERSSPVTNDDSVTVKSGKLLTIDILYVIIYDIADYVY